MATWSRLDRDTRALAALLLVFVAATVAISVLPQWLPLAPGPMPPKWVIAAVNGGSALVLYGILGLIGLRLGRRIGFAPVWPERIDSAALFLRPALVGVVLGAGFVAVDLVLTPLHGLRPLPHPPFPQSVFASLAAGIGEEVIFRLFFIGLWVWLLDRLIFRGRGQSGLFWVVAVASALVFAMGHLPALLAILGREVTPEAVAALPPALVAEVVILNGALSLVAARALRDHGLVAAAGIHFWTDVVWHVVWGPLSG
ncbi:MAG: CPBP family glutamic-type intramembrane protease [Paracoccaceae bacterium]